VQIAKIVFIGVRVDVKVKWKRVYEITGSVFVG
jgi:hypothetical protein